MMVGVVRRFGGVASRYLAGIGPMGSKRRYNLTGWGSHKYRLFCTLSVQSDRLGLLFLCVLTRPP